MADIDNKKSEGLPEPPAEILIADSKPKFDVEEYYSFCLVWHSSLVFII